MTICSIDILLFAILNQFIVPCPVLPVASCPVHISQETGKVVWYFHLFKNFPEFVVIHTVKGFGIVSKAEVDVFWNSLAFSVIHHMLAIWSLVPLPFLNLTYTSGSSWFTYCCNLAWKIFPSDSKEIKPVNPKGNQPWIFIERTDAKTEALILWSPDSKSWFIGKYGVWSMVGAWFFLVVRVSCCGLTLGWEIYPADN